MMVTLAVMYRYAPDRHEAQWKWISPGAITAMVLWGIGSLLFTLYVTHFNSYEQTYGALGAVAVLLTWLWLSSYVVLLGAEIKRGGGAADPARFDGRPAEAHGLARSLCRRHARENERRGIGRNGGLGPRWKAGAMDA